MFKTLFRKDTFSWALYDWANSAFSTSIMAVLFPLFYKNYWNAGVEATTSTARLGMTIGLSSALIAVLAPLLGALADEASAKKKFLFVSVLMGSIATLALAAVGEGHWLPASGIYLIAIVCFSASLIFYDSLILGVSSDDNVDFVSGAGYALGYLGGGVLLALNVFMLLKPELIGLTDKTMAVKASFVSVGLWWLLFSLPLFLFVKEPYVKRSRPVIEIFRNSFINILATVKKIIKMKNVFYFMLAYWLYIDGVYTIIKMAMDFALSLGLNQDELIKAFLIVQFVGFPAALLFGWLGQKWDLKKSILLGIACYVVVVLFAIKMKTAHDFQVMAVMVGMVQGGVQALSRSFYARLIPPQSSGEFFGLYNLVGKAASVLGPPLLGFVTYLSGDARYGIASLLLLLLAGGALLMFKVDNPQPNSGSR